MSAAFKGLKHQHLQSFSKLVCEFIEVYIQCGSLVLYKGISNRMHPFVRSENPTIAHLDVKDTQNYALQHLYEASGIPSHCGARGHTSRGATPTCCLPLEMFCGLERPHAASLVLKMPSKGQKQITADFLLETERDTFCP